MVFVVAYGAANFNLANGIKVRFFNYLVLEVCMSRSEEVRSARDDILLLWSKQTQIFTSIRYVIGFAVYLSPTINKMR